MMRHLSCQTFCLERAQISRPLAPEGSFAPDRLDTTTPRHRAPSCEIANLELPGLETWHTQSSCPDMPRRLSLTTLESGGRRSRILADAPWQEQKSKEEAILLPNPTIKRFCDVQWRRGKATMRNGWWLMDQSLAANTGDVGARSPAMLVLSHVTPQGSKTRVTNGRNGACTSTSTSVFHHQHPDY